MAEWSITIKQTGSKIEFVPQLQPITPSGLNVSQGDVVTWNNTTTKTQQPWPANSSFQQQASGPGQPNYFVDPIPAGFSSDSWTAPPQPQGTVFPVAYYYIDKDDPKAQGVITVTN